MYKKIDVFIKTPNGWQYLWSTNSYIRCKDALNNTKKCLKQPCHKRPYEKKYNVQIDSNTKIIARFDKLWKEN